MKIGSMVCYVVNDSLMEGELEGITTKGVMVRTSGGATGVWDRVFSVDALALVDQSLASRRHGREAVARIYEDTLNAIAKDHGVNSVEV